VIPCPECELLRRHVTAVTVYIAAADSAVAIAAAKAALAAHLATHGDDA